MAKLVTKWFIQCYRPLSQTETFSDNVNNSRSLELMHIVWSRGKYSHKSDYQQLGSN